MMLNYLGIDSTDYLKKQLISLNKSEKKRTMDDLENIASLFKEILSKNETCRFFNHDQLKRELGRRFFYACFFKVFDCIFLLYRHHYLRHHLQNYYHYYCLL